MNVLYFVNDFPVLSETFILNEILDHVQAGTDVRVVSLGVKPRYEWAEAILSGPLAGRVTYLNVHLRGNARQRIMKNVSAVMGALVKPPIIRQAWKKRDLRLLRTLKAAKVLEADIIHAHFGHMGILAGRMRNLGAIRGTIITTVHGFDISKSKYSDNHQYQRELVNGVDLVLSVNCVWRDMLLESGCIPHKVQVHHLGVDTERLRPDNGTNSTPTFLSVGRFVEKKGHRYSIEAFAELRGRSPNLRCRLEIIGDGPLLASCKDLVQNLGMEQDISLPGAMPHEATLARLKSAGMFILPSVTASDGNMEGIPVSLMEAMAHGIPTISTKHSGIPELISDGIDGVLVGERDAKALSEAMERILVDKEFAEHIGRNGREKVERDFDIRTQGRKLRQVYESILGLH